MRCVRQVPLTTWALAASAAVGVAAADDASARAGSSCLGLTCGAPGRERLGRVEHRRQRLVLDLDERRGLARACAASSAATAASTSPTQRASSPSATKPGQSA